MPQQTTRVESLCRYIDKQLPNNLETDSGVIVRERYIRERCKGWKGMLSFALSFLPEKPRRVAEIYKTSTTIEVLAPEYLQFFLELAKGYEKYLSETKERAQRLNVTIQNLPEQETVTVICEKLTAFDFENGESSEEWFDPEVDDEPLYKNISRRQ